MLNAAKDIPTVTIHITFRLVTTFAEPWESCHLERDHTYLEINVSS